MSLLHILAVLMLCGAFAQSAAASIHPAPIIIKGFNIRHATRFPLSSYRLYRTDDRGRAVAIPFQIDEIDENEDFVLDQGKVPNIQMGNSVFDLRDELSFMGDDVGPVRAPTVWPMEKPQIIYEIKHQFSGAQVGNYPREGAVYLGIYFNKPPPLSTKNYVVFNPNLGRVETSRYIYNFDQLNYLVVSGVDMKSRDPKQSSTLPLLSSSTFYLKADLKYFLTLEVHQKDVQSSLEAFKVGPIRSIVRVTFFYRFLKLNFELGMYTEVSLFSNSVILPAIMYNPLEGKKNLNPGSGFYYGFAVTDNPATLDVQSNIPQYQESGLFDFFKKSEPLSDLYWLSITGPERMMYFEVIPSAEMKANQNIPSLFKDHISGTEAIASRKSDRAMPLGKSPVNLALHFDLTKFGIGQHLISFKLLFDNVYDPKLMEVFRNLHKWDIQHQRL